MIRFVAAGAIGLGVVLLAWAARGAAREEPKKAAAAAAAAPARLGSLAGYVQ